MVLLIVFVGLAVGAAASFMEFEAEPPPDLIYAGVQIIKDCGGDAWLTGNERVILVHTGGEPFPISGLRSLVTLGGVVYNEPLGDGHLNIGEEIDLTGPLVLAPGDVPEARIAWVDHSGSSRIVKEVQVAADRCARPLLDLIPPPPIPDIDEIAFQDLGCDGYFHPDVDLPIDHGVLRNGTYATQDAWCLTILAAFGKVTAPSIAFTSPNGGIILNVDLEATNTTLTLSAPGGLIDVAATNITARGDITLDADGRIDLDDTLVESLLGRISVNSGGGIVDADHARIKANMGGLAHGQSMYESNGEPTAGYVGPGAINICKIIVDQNGYITSGFPHPGTEFTVQGLDSPLPSQYPQAGRIGDTVHDSTLVLNADLVYSDGLLDAECVTYDGLALGGYFYGQESLSEYDGWIGPPKYNDIAGPPTSGLHGFCEYTNQLFTPDPDDDPARNTNCDGHIILSNGRPVRTVIVLNELDTTRPPQIEIRSEGNLIDLEDACVVAQDGSVVIASSGGAILGDRMVGQAHGDGADLTMRSSGGTIRLDDAQLLARAGIMQIIAGRGAVLASGLDATSRGDLTIRGSQPILVEDAQLTSVFEDLVLDGVRILNTIYIDGAEFRDANDAALLLPAGINVDGVLAYGGLE